MYQAIYKCKLCGIKETENIADSDIDIEKHKYPLCAALKYHHCEDNNLGVIELVGIKKKPKTQTPV